MEEGVELISRAMDAEEAEYARTTFEFHFACRRHGIDDGRRLFVWQAASGVQGIVGLHRYLWGPPEHVWLSWFAVDPAYYGTGLGARLFVAASDLARDLGYEKLFIEAYSSPTFARAVRFYERQGFHRAGGIDDYLPDGASMRSFSRRIQSAREDASERDPGAAT